MGGLVDAPAAASLRAADGSGSGRAHRASTTSAVGACRLNFTIRL